jgi:hypothetical protein
MRSTIVDRISSTLHEKLLWRPHACMLFVYDVILFFSVRQCHFWHVICRVTSPTDSGVITVIRTSKPAIFNRLMLVIGASPGYTDMIFIFRVPLDTHTYKTWLVSPTSTLTSLTSHTYKTWLVSPSSTLTSLTSHTYKTWLVSPTSTLTSLTSVR